MEIFEEKILDYLKKHPNSDLKRIISGLKISETDSNHLSNYLKKLEIKGIIYQNKNGAYILLEDKDPTIHRFLWTVNSVNHPFIDKETLRWYNIGVK